MLVKAVQTPLPELPNKTEVYNYVQKYAKPNNTQAWWELLSTVVIYVLIIGSGFKWFFFVILVGLRMRMFVIFHDLGHQSFFSNSALNRIVGTVIGPIVWTPYSYWVTGHNYHHKVSNNLDKSQYAQSSPWTVQQFHQHNKYIRWLYAAVYGQFTFWTIMPSIYFIVIQRLYARWYENLLHVCWLGCIVWSSWDNLKFDLLVIFFAAFCGFFFFMCNIPSLEPTESEVRNGTIMKTAWEDLHIYNCLGTLPTLVLAFIITTFTTSIHEFQVTNLNNATMKPMAFLIACLAWL